MFGDSNVQDGLTLDYKLNFSDEEYKETSVYKINKRSERIPVLFRVEGTSILFEEPLSLVEGESLLIESNTLF